MMNINLGGVSMGATELDRREWLIDLWNHGVNSVKGRQSVKAYFDKNKAPKADYSVIAVGKAAADMMLGATDVLGEKIKAGLVLTKYDHLDAELNEYPQIVCHESSHPMPDQSSLNAGQLLLKEIASIPEHHEVLMLISGGASSVVDVLREPCELSHLQQLNKWALHNGLNINEINYMRQQVSLIKGGELCNYFNANRVLCLYISDVPEDNMNVIGSGLLYKDQAIADLISVESKMRIDAYLQQTVDMSDSRMDDSEPLTLGQFTHQVIANNDLAKSSMVSYAEKNNYQTYLMPETIDMDYRKVAVMIAGKVSSDKPGIYIWGGEPTVDLPNNPGKGGRNQALALLLAVKFSRSPNISILVAGTDGTDGPTEAAGGIIDNFSYSNAIAVGQDPLMALRQADSYPCLQAINSLFVPGPTGTNVMDLVIVYQDNSFIE